MRQLRVAVVGATGVGKTSLVRAHVNNSFTREHHVTRRTETYTETVWYGPEQCVLRLDDTVGLDLERSIAPLLQLEPPRFLRPERPDRVDLEAQALADLERADGAAASEKVPLLAEVPGARAETLDRVHAYILVYDITNAATLKMIHLFATELAAMCKWTPETDNITVQVPRNNDIFERKLGPPTPFVVVANKTDAIGLEAGKGSDELREVLDAGRQMAASFGMPFREVSVARSKGVALAFSDALIEIQLRLTLQERMWPLHCCGLYHCSKRCCCCGPVVENHACNCCRAPGTAGIRLRKWGRDHCRCSLL